MSTKASGLVYCIISRNISLRLHTSIAFSNCVVTIALICSDSVSLYSIELIVSRSFRLSMGGRNGIAFTSYAPVLRKPAALFPYMRLKLANQSLLTVPKLFGYVSSLSLYSTMSIAATMALSVGISVLCLLV